jgi:hypothetical protein
MSSVIELWQPNQAQSIYRIHVRYLENTYGRHYTSHNFCAIQGMDNAGFEIHQVILMSGHRIESPVRSICDCSTEQKKSFWVFLFLISWSLNKVNTHSAFGCEKRVHQHDGNPHRICIPLYAVKEFRDLWLYISLYIQWLKISVSKIWCISNISTCTLIIIFKISYVICRS